MDPHDPDDPTDGPEPSSDRDQLEGHAAGSPSSPSPHRSPPPDLPPPGAPGPSWTPPDAGSVPGQPSNRSDIEAEDADGPPVPPPVRRRLRRRRRRAMLVGAIVVVVGVPVGLAVATMFGDDDAPFAIGDDALEDEVEDDGTGDDSTGDDSTGDDSTGEDDGTPEDDGATGDDAGAGPGTDNGSGDADALAPPDLEVLAGEDAVYGQLLVDIDASERVMIGFQDEVAEAFSGPSESPDQLLEQVQEIGEASRDDLLGVRERLDDELDVEGAEQVRDLYVAHLDSWADYMDAVSEDPTVLGGEGAGGGFTVVINATADAFARALETELPEDADEQVRVYADEILDRGFRGGSDAQV